MPGGADALRFRAWGGSRAAEGEPVGWFGCGADRCVCRLCGAGSRAAGRRVLWLGADGDRDIVGGKRGPLGARPAAEPPLACCKSAIISSLTPPVCMMPSWARPRKAVRLRPVTEIGSVIVLRVSSRSSRGDLNANRARRRSVKLLRRLMDGSLGMIIGVRLKPGLLLTPLRAGVRRGAPGTG